MADLPDVRVGDIWTNNDPRGGPTLVVERICHETEVDCPRFNRWLEPHAHVTAWEGSTPRRRTILLRRFRPTRSGYRLIERREPTDA